MESGAVVRGRGAAARRGAGVRAAVVLTVAIAAIGACGSPSGAGASPVDAGSIFTDRAVLASCGELRLGQGEEVPAEAWACVDAAFDTGAELAVEMPTTEGDPIVTYYRVGPDIDGLELFTDTTRDNFGPQTWSHEVCPDTVTVREPLGCEEV